MKGVKIISKELKDSTNNVIEFLIEKNIKVPSVLNVLSRKRISEPQCNPKVLIEYEYEHYRQGSFSENYILFLSDYLLLSASKSTFSWSDCLGKHSSLEASIDEFSVNWYYENESCNYYRS